MLNVAVVMGRLVADPELRHTPSDVAVTSFTLAVDRSYVKSGTERQADFIDVVAWRSTADFVCKYFRKGQMMAVHGSIQTRTYTDKDGNKRRSAEVVADHHNLIDAIERCDLAAFEPLVERHLYGGIRRLGSKLTEEYADYFE